MPDFLNPALAAFQKLLLEPIKFIEVLITPERTGFELRHRQDEGRDSTVLQLLAAETLTEWADFTSAGAFRPNKAAPSLRSGWRCQVKDDRELERALDALYPGALADWYAGQIGSVAAFSVREFTARQTGLYRSIHKLTDGQIGELTCAVCHRQFCLRRRSWEIADLPVDSLGTKSSVPCWEPCALWLEFARRTTRIAEEEPVAWELRPSEVQSIVAALQLALAATDPGIREGDSSHPANPRRFRQLLDRFLASRFSPTASKEI